MMSKLVCRCFVVASILLLGAALWQLDFLRIPHVLSWSTLALSVGVCCAGSLAAAMTWRSALLQVGVRTSRSACIAAIGLPVFGKYVPGKVWTIVGRAGYTANVTHHSLSELSGTSLSLEIVTVWVGLGMGSLGVALAGGVQRLSVVSIGVWLVLGVVLVLSPGEAFLQEAARRLRLPMPKLKLLRISNVFRVLPWQVFTWGAWALGFYVLVRSLVPAPMPWSVALAFPLATSLGIVAVFCPSGIGVREGVLTGYLALHGMTVSEAAGVAVAARLWFILGEVFIFLCGAIAHYGRHAKRTSEFSSS